ncbi:MAG: DoxX family protein [Chitinophagaceae bacterium]|nr:DoxX family protein [Chitinophagaceae bacterium]
MNLINRLENWGDRHHPKWLDFIRIATGLIIMLKGVQFINNMQPLTDMMAKNGFLGSAGLGIAVHIVVFANLLGGALILFGLLTRAACVVLIPVMLGAIFIVNLPAGISQTNAELWLSVIILFLLVLFAIEGSGKLSFDEWMRTHSDERPHKHKWE